ncbi:hypothetical protein DRQ25_16165, partial [Candidatus Fermentibacteria bacterium]
MKLIIEVTVDDEEFSFLDQSNLAFAYRGVQNHYAKFKEIIECGQLPLHGAIEEVIGTFCVKPDEKDSKPDSEISIMPIRDG